MGIPRSVVRPQPNDFVLVVVVLDNTFFIFLFLTSDIISRCRKPFLLRAKHEEQDGYSNLMAPGIPIFIFCCFRKYFFVLFFFFFLLSPLIVIIAVFNTIENRHFPFFLWALSVF